MNGSSFIFVLNMRTLIFNQNMKYERFIFNLNMKNMCKNTAIFHIMVEDEKSQLGPKYEI